MKLILFPTTVATILYAVQHWEWALYLALWALLTGAFYCILYSVYRFLFP